MMIVVLYDIAVDSGKDAKRLQKVAKICLRWGTRIQNSVFECEVNDAQYRELKKELAQAIDSNRDSIRYYRLGNAWQGRIEQTGISAPATEKEYVL